MNVWYEITPVDTLFFRGATPMEAGQMTSRSLFPPPVTVVEGALRSAVLARQSISGAAYRRGDCPEKVLSQIGRCGEAAPFKVTAVMLSRNGHCYVPAPAHWYLEKSKDHEREAVEILRAGLFPEELAALGAVTSLQGDIPFLPRAHRPERLTEKWVALEKLTAENSEVLHEDLVESSELYGLEHRTGIGLDNRRRVIEGRLYSANHIRLREGCQLVVGIDREIGLAEAGILQLGGERRLAGYRKITVPPLPEEGQGLYMALVPMMLTESLLSRLFCSAAPETSAGWDMAVGFHKPTRQWLPAGSVFTENIDNICVAIH